MRLRKQKHNWGISFIEQLAGFESYMIDASARATFTSGFERYVL
jgi:hypothetical protein